MNLKQLHETRDALNRMPTTPELNRALSAIDELIQKEVESISFFGHVFKPMDSDDCMAFSDASKGALICHVSLKLVLIYDRAKRVMIECMSDDEGGHTERHWKFELEI